MTLFSHISRTSVKPKAYAQPEFEFLDRSAWPEAQRVRDVVEYWLAHVPAQDAGVLIQRMRSGSDQEFNSATFELYLHELMRRLGNEVEIHPPAPGESKKHPDFLVKPPGEKPYYLEAVLATDATAAEKGGNALVDAILDGIASMDCPDFYLALSYCGAPKTAPSLNDLRNAIRQNLKSLDPDAMAQALERDSKAKAPTFQFHHGDWILRYSPHPKSPELRGPGSAVIAMITLGLRPLTSWKAIRNVVKKKGSRYGEMDRPYLIAVNAGAFHTKESDVRQALYGQERVLFRDGVAQEGFAGDGAWIDKKGQPQYRRISGVLIIPGWSVWDSSQREAWVYHNRWAERPLGSSIDKLPHERVVKQFVRQPGLHPRELLSLGKGWPESV